MRSVVMSDVAREAGVSQQTVSRVLHDHPSVRPETRARVNDAIERLGYRPNLAARSLAAGRSRTVGVLLMSQLSHGTAATFAAIADSARQEGYQLVVASAQDDSSGSVLKALDDLAGYRVAASIILARRMTALDELGSRPLQHPRILLAGQGGIDGAATVAIDQTAGAVAATEHLVRTGRSRLVHVTGDLSSADAIARRDAFLRTCAELGAEGVVVDSGGWSAEAGVRAGAEALGASPDGVFAANDDLALGVMRALHDAGYRVPEHVGLVGFDDVPTSRMLVPALTTVVQDFQALGRAVMAQVIAVADGEEPRDVLLPARLVIRESTRPVGRGPGRDDSQGPAAAPTTSLPEDVTGTVGRRSASRAPSGRRS